jgi:ribonuclease HII
MTQLHLFQEPNPQIGEIEKQLYQSGGQYCIGVDEAGRGPWAGSVVASAVLFPLGNLPDRLLLLNDSKKLKPKQRRSLSQPIFDHALAVGVAESKAHIVDQVNILQATFLAMKRAIELVLEQGDQIKVDWIFIDGKQTLPFDFKIPQKAIVKGDSRSYHIAAASIIAKEVRDQQMQIAHRHFPQYHFHKHKGYGTRLHQEMIAQYGICPLHRQTFKPIKRHIEAIK